MPQLPSCVLEVRKVWGRGYHRPVQYHSACRSSLGWCSLQRRTVLNVPHSPQCPPRSSMPPHSPQCPPTVLNAPHSPQCPPQSSMPPTVLNAPHSPQCPPQSAMPPPTILNALHSLQCPSHKQTENRSSLKGAPGPIIQNGPTQDPWKCKTRKPALRTACLELTQGTHQPWCHHDSTLHT